MRAPSSADRTAGPLQPLAMDVRSLAAFRIGIAAVLLVDLARRARDLGVHYTDAGMVSRADVLADFGSLHEWAVCVHLATGSWIGTALLFAVPARRVLGLATVALLAQIAVIHVGPALAEAAEPSWRDGTALVRILNDEPHVSRAGVWLAGHESACALLTHAVWIWELAAVGLLVVPVAFGPLRVAVVAGLWLTLGLFPLVDAVLLLALLPSWCWERLGTSPDDRRWPALLCGRHVCRTWNAAPAGGRLLDSFELVFMRRSLRPEPPYRRPPENYERHVTWRHWCFE